MKTEILIIIICVIIILLTAGCSQRICEYNPTTGVWRYKSNHFATESQADKVTITTPSGIVIEIDNAAVDNDSIKAVTPYGIVETD
jgi:hypothetical protein